MERAERARVPVRTDADVITARQLAREQAAHLRFSTTDLTFIATAVSELARNIVEYAPPGEVLIRIVQRNDQRGLEVVAEDRGPGIADIPRVLLGGYSTGGSLGIGISGARRLMDEFQIDSEVGKGTRITMRKWERRQSTDPRGSRVWL